MASSSHSPILTPPDLEELSLKELTALIHDWSTWARPNQLPPDHPASSNHPPNEPILDWDYWVALAGRGFGKALALDTLIPTPRGLTPLSDIQTGDQVYAPDGTTTRVLMAHPAMHQRPCYKVQFDNGQSVIADEGHLWATIPREQRRRPKSQFKSIHTTKEIRDSLRIGSTANHFIPATQPLDSPAKPLIIDPYLLGYWLGDGSSKAWRFTILKDDINPFQSKLPIGISHRIEQDKSPNCWDVKLSNGTPSSRGLSTGRYESNESLQSQLRYLSIYQNKHIPQQYLLSSVSQRLELLRGLMDSDGSINKRGNQASFYSTNSQLADDAYYLMSSLGYVVSRSIKYPKVTGKPGANCAPCHILRIRPKQELNPFSLPRKRDRVAPLANTQSSRLTGRFIVSVTPVSSVPVRCLTVEHPSKLYLITPDCIPTHNTRLGAEQVLNWVDKGYRRIAIIAPTTADTRDVVTEGESGILTVAHPSKRPHYEPSKRRLTFPNGAIATLYSAEEPERLRGPQFDAAWCLTPDTLVQTQLGPIPIESINPQIHLAYTPWGYRKIYSRILTNSRAEVCTLSVQSGKISGTPSHLVYERGSFTKLGDATCATLVKNIEGKSTIFVREEGTSWVGKFWPEWSTRMKWASYLPGMRFIIRTMIGRMIQSRIWYYSLVKSMLESIEKRGHLGISLGMTLLPKSSIPVSSATLLSSQKSGLGEEESQSFALESASRNGEELSSSLKNAFVRCVRLPIKLLSRFRSTVAKSVIEKHTVSVAPTLTQEKVLSVEKSLTLSPVYDLGVEGGVFIANGFLVHNCDEIAAWQYPQEVWDMLHFGLRLGKHPQVVVSTTPKPIPLIRQLIERSKKDPRKVVLTTGSTYDNKANLASTFFTQVAQYEGTRLGRQELHAELIDPRESGIVRTGWLKLFPRHLPLPKFIHILQSYDTAFTEKTLDRKTKDPDPSAQSTWGVFALNHQIRSSLKEAGIEPPSQHIEYGVMLLDSWSDHLGFPELRARVKKDWDSSYYGPEGDARRADVVLIEDKGSGISLRQELQSVVPVQKYNPGRADKFERLHAISHIPCQGMVFIPESSKEPGKFVKWADPLIDQVCSFPLVDHDDYVDTFSQALLYYKDQGYLSVDPQEFEEEYADDRSKQRRNPYSA